MQVPCYTSNQDKNKQSPVAEVASFLPNGELKETGPSTEKKKGEFGSKWRQRGFYKRQYKKGVPQKDGKRRGIEEGKKVKGTRVGDNKGKMERNIRRRRRENSRHRSRTPPPSPKGAHHEANESTTEKHPETVEAPENQEEETLRPTAVPGGEGEETEMRPPRSKSNQKKGASGSKSSQEQDTPHRLEPQGKTQGMADERKKQSRGHAQ